MQHLPQTRWPHSPPAMLRRTLTWLGGSLRAADGGDAAEGWPALLHLGGRRDARERSAPLSRVRLHPCLPSYLVHT